MIIDEGYGRGGHAVLVTATTNVSLAVLVTCAIFKSPVPLNYNFIFPRVVPCSISHGKSYNYLRKYNFTRNKTWHLAWHLQGSLHDMCNLHGKTLSRGSIIYNPRK